MHDTIIKRDAATSWKEWLESAPGRSALAWEKAQFDALVSDVFGYYAVQMGLPEIDALRMNRMPSRILASTEWPIPTPTAGREALDPTTLTLGDGPMSSASHTTSPIGPRGDESVPGSTAESTAESTAYTHRLVVDQFEDLPFGDQSLDLIVLPHVLEFAADPHRVLREVDRVLRPEGRVVVSGLNPVSLWGARHIVPRQWMRPFLPAEARFIGLPRLRDWFKLLSFELDRGHYGCYAPPFRSQVWLDRSHFMEKAGDRWWPVCGGVYCITAIKRVRAIRLVGPAWKSRETPRRRVAVAASHNRSRQTADLE